MVVKMLKPRLAPMDTSIAKPLQGTGWRAGKTTGGRGYDYAWQKYRERFLQANPLCVYCMRDDQRPTAATVVDHIVPHEGDRELFTKTSNHQALCASCHSGKKAREEGRGVNAT